MSTTRSLTRRCNRDVTYYSCQQHRQTQLSTFHFFSSLVWFSAPLQHFLARCKNKFRGINFADLCPGAFPRMPASVGPLSPDTQRGIGSSAYPSLLYSANIQPTISASPPSTPSVPHFTRSQAETWDKAMMVTIRSSEFFLECAPAVNHRWADRAAELAPPWRRSKR